MLNMNIPGIADKAFTTFPNSLIEFSVSVVSIAPLDSVTLALEDELNKADAVSQSIPISNPQSIVQWLPMPVVKRVAEVDRLPLAVPPVEALVDVTVISEFIELIASIELNELP